MTIGIEDDKPAENTYRQLWVERNSNPMLANSIHVTAEGAIGINVGGHVIVKSLEGWYAAALRSPDRYLNEYAVPRSDKLSQDDVNPDYVSNTPQSDRFGRRLQTIEEAKSKHDRSTPRTNWHGEPLDNQCRSARDGECSWDHCPQLRDNEPYVTGRHCPLDVGCYICGMIECEC